MEETLASWGEQFATEYLLECGWRILDRNWRCRSGEIDIVADEPEPDGPGTVVVVEVKTRGGNGYGNPLEAITDAKARRLRQLAAAWRRDHPQLRGSLRIDGIGIMKLAGRRPVLHHVRGIR
jgi:putative endonuclease